MREAEKLRHQLASVPEPEVIASPAVERAIADSVRYLGSDAAAASIEADTYWPKWDSPWWHMLLLFEIGEARQIPERAITKMIDGVNALPLHTFPIHPEDSPPGTDPYRDTSCHCALGSLYQVLFACGVDVDAALPWVKPWFARYQMADGGLNCDNDAYLVAGECPSSMVGLIAAFEAMLLGSERTPEQRKFLEHGAGFLVERQLRLGSSSRYNAAERVSAASWTLPCFPRFYFYDVLRGLSALVRWAEAAECVLPVTAVADVVDHLATRFPDGAIRRERRSFEGSMTMTKLADGQWVRRQPASHFELLDVTSALGEPCPYSTRQWSAARAGLLRLIDADRLAG